MSKKKEFLFVAICALVVLFVIMFFKTIMFFENMKYKSWNLTIEKNVKDIHVNIGNFVKQIDVDELDNKIALEYGIYNENNVYINLNNEKDFMVSDGYGGYFDVGFTKGDSDIISGFYLTYKNVNLNNCENLLSYAYDAGWKEFSLSDKSTSGLFYSESEKYVFSSVGKENLKNHCVSEKNIAIRLYSY